MGRDTSRGNDAGGQIIKRLIIALLLSSPALATTWYASPSGSGTACTSGSPCTTTQAETNAVAGDTIRFKDGTYPVTVFTKSGTSGAHLILISDNKWGAKFTGASSAGGSVFRSNGNFVEIRNIEVSGSANAVDGIILGALAGVITNGLIDGNKVHGIANPTCNGGGGIHIWNNLNSSGVTVSNNIIYDIGAHGTCTQQHGIYSNGSGHKLLNNLIYNVTGYGIHLWHTATNQVVANNTIVHCGTTSSSDGILIGGDVTEGINNNTATFNNIVVDSGRYGISEHGSYGASNVFSDNLTFNNPTNTRSDTATPLPESGAIHSDPLFVNENPLGVGDYHLQAASPARNTGIASLVAGSTTGTAPTTDIEGTTRPQESAYEMGAYEFIGSSSIIAYVQSVKTTGAGTTPTLALPANAGLNNSIFVSVGLVSGTATMTAPTDTQGLTYTKAIGPIVNSGITTYIWWANAATAGADTVTLHLSASVASHIVVAEYSAAGSGFVQDVFASGTGTSTTATSGNMSTTVANELVLAIADTATTPGAPIAFVRQATATSTSGTSLPVTIVAPGVGSALVAVVGGQQHTSSISGGGVTWVQAATTCTHSCTEIWYGLNSSGSGTTVTATLSSASTAESISVSEYSGVLTASALDKTAIVGSSSNSTSILTPSVSPAVDGELLVGAAIPSGNGGTESAGPTNSFTALTSVGVGTYRSVQGYLVQPVGAATSTGWTWSTSTQYDAAIITLKPANAAGGISAGSGFVARQTGATYISVDDILVATTTLAASAVYSSSLAWAIAGSAFYTAPNAPPPPPPPPGVPPPSIVPSPCP